MLSLAAPAADRPLGDKHVILKQRPGHHQHRPTFWYDRNAGRLLNEKGVLIALPQHPQLIDVLRSVAASQSSPSDHYVVWVLGGDRAANTPERQWFTAPVAQGDGAWEIVSYQGGSAEDATARAAQYIGGDATIDVRLVAAWFSEVADIDTARRGYLRLWSTLRSAFGQTVIMLPTPAMTGLELLQQNLPRGYEYPPVDDALMRLCYSMPQGRYELFTDKAERHINAERDVLPGVWLLDGVFMYASTIKEMPVGRCVNDKAPVYWEHAPGFYSITAQVPADWSHVGLLPHYKPDGSRCYPWRRGVYCTANGWFASFVTSAELNLARQHGWKVNIHERWLFPDKKGDPLASWGNKIKATREAWSLVDDPIAPLVRDGLRHVLLDPIGAFHRRLQDIEGFVAYGHEHEIPPEAIPGSTHREEHGVAYRVPAEPTRYHKLWMHPEWSATVWGRVRNRGAWEMLRHPVDELVAYRVDGLWLSYNPGYMASTHAGDWRLKSRLERPVKAPHDTTALIRLMRRARAMEG